MTSPEETRPVDLAVLEAQTGGDGALEREVLGLFRHRVPAEIERLRSGDGDVSSIAHGIVGSARAIGATGLASAAAAIEADGVVEPAARDRLEAEYRRVERFIAERTRRPE